METFLDLLLGLLQQPAEVAELNLSELTLHPNLGWLHFRAAAGVDATSLEVSQDFASQTITAELWRPSGLVVAVDGGTMDDVVDRRKAWSYDEVTDPEYLAWIVASAVTDWLDWPRGGDGSTGRATAPRVR
jgi:hypothetical protein